MFETGKAPPVRPIPGFPDVEIPTTPGTKVVYPPVPWPDELPWPEKNPWKPPPLPDWPPRCDTPLAWQEFADRFMRLLYQVSQHRISHGLLSLYPWWDLRNCWMYDAAVADLALQWLAYMWNLYGTQYFETPGTTSHFVHLYSGVSVDSHFYRNVAHLLFSVWLYDDMRNLATSGAYVTASAYNAEGSASAMVYQTGSDNLVEIAVSRPGGGAPDVAYVARSLGWHLFTATYAGGTVTATYDGQVAQMTGYSHGHFETADVYLNPGSSSVMSWQSGTYSIDGAKQVFGPGAHVFNDWACLPPPFAFNTHVEYTRPAEPWPSLGHNAPELNPPAVPKLDEAVAKMLLGWTAEAEAIVYSHMGL